MTPILRPLLVATTVACAGAPLAPVDPHGLSGPVEVAITDTATFAAPPVRTVEVRAGGDVLVLDLVRNDDLFAPGYAQYDLLPDGTLELQPRDQWANAHACFYTGDVLQDGAVVGVAGVSTCVGRRDGDVRGLVTFDGVLYDLDDLGAGPELAVVPALPIDGELPMAARVVDGVEALGAQAGQAPPPGDRWVELLGVNDVLRAQQEGADVEDDTALLVNAVDALYDGASFQRAIDVVMTAQVTFQGSDPYTTLMSGGEADIDDLLTDFQAWQATVSSFDFDNAQLYSGYNFSGSTIGYAPLFAMCNRQDSASIVQTRNASVAFNAATAAHEMGHNFGMFHDENQGCSSDYIMAAGAGPIIPTQWSSCSTDDIDGFYAQGLGGCTTDVPTETWDGDLCGNGVVDDGEACDCGFSGCQGVDPCCNGNTCQLAAGAVCSSLDPCCTDQCGVESAGVSCRASGDACDLAETCDGVSPACPTDLTLAAGTACTDDLGFPGDCYLGDCVSYEGQCALYDDLFQGDFEGTQSCFDAAAAQIGVCQQLACDVANVPGLTDGCYVLPDPDNTSVDAFLEDGTRCDVDSQCVGGSCTPSADISGDPFCGDGQQDPGEDCDDANQADGDGCTADCEDEFCGDGTRQVLLGEACDDGNMDDGDGCSALCVVERCGDSIVQAGLGETCDDGNRNSGDGCSRNCDEEICGDGVWQPSLGEACDDGNQVDTDSCPNDCGIAPAPTCGDGTIDTGEDCDDGNTESNDGCDDQCQREVCGDGIVQDGIGEACDDGNRRSNDGCSRLCRVEFCGDGVVHTGLDEVCDDGVDNSDTAPDACRTTCLPAGCGDGVVDSAEVCDDGNDVDGDGCSATCGVEPLEIVSVVPADLSTDNVVTVRNGTPGAWVHIATGATPGTILFPLVCDGALSLPFDDPILPGAAQVGPDGTVAIDIGAPYVMSAGKPNRVVAVELITCRVSEVDLRTW